MDVSYPRQLQLTNRPILGKGHTKQISTQAQVTNTVRLQQMLRCKVIHTHIQCTHIQIDTHTSLPWLLCTVKQHQIARWCQWDNQNNTSTVFFIMCVIFTYWLWFLTDTPPPPDTHTRSHPTLQVTCFFRQVMIPISDGLKYRSDCLNPHHAFFPNQFLGPGGGGMSTKLRHSITV